MRSNRTRIGRNGRAQRDACFAFADMETDCPTLHVRFNAFPTIAGTNQCYEGMKVFRDSQGRVRMFRPEKNMSRFNQSAHRLCLPQFNEDELLRCIQALVLLDKDWIPQRRGCAMYLRPVMFSTTPWLGLTQCSEAMLFVLQSPVGPYFKSGYVPIMLHVEQKMIRAWPGGTGNFKCGGNYGPTVSSQIVAARSGCSQALYVYDDKNLWVTEAGTMNIFFLWVTPEGKKQLVTPTLADGTILPGITRRSVMELAESWGECEVVEKMLPLREVILACEEGRLLEAFGTGTAAVIQPVQGFIHEGKSYLFPEEGSGPASLQSRLVKRLTDIQYGEVPHPWSIVLE